MVTSLLAGTTIDKILNINGGIPYYVGVMIGSLLPDIDLPQSFIGRRSFGLAKVINNAFGQRGITHSFLSTILLEATPYALLPAQLARGLTVRFLSHILRHFFSKTGVPFSAPPDNTKYN